MLHGFSSTPQELKKLSDYLSGKGFNISIPLIDGHGTSLDDFTRSSPSDWMKSAKDAYFELSNISEKIFIIGNSFGANLGLWIAKESDKKFF